MESETLKIAILVCLAKAMGQPRRSTRNTASSIHDLFAAKGEEQLILHLRLEISFDDR